MRCEDGHRGGRQPVSRKNGGPGCLPQQDGRIAIPEPLRMYMGGKAYIG
ncbi:hypothetical protein H8K20_05755 [Neobittarella massiliensis]|uniref:Uncharacterized protein n=1 Tax=Neobittarella massiliensis (ex Bilen et al. 2018) TaxID=2041842 RepID=A0A8J6LTW0_9FIRM|nr:hypothetical protein [Neobittarella massiliensis]MBC3515899.1 hypothetical protein [Neobittarella massiliensis]